MSSAVDRLAAQILRLERNVRALSVTPQLAHSSIEDGGSVNSNNADGTTMAQYGGQFDGSYMAASLVGPTPPTPSDPIVTAAIGGLTVRWDGLFTDADFAPMDFTRVEVHVSTVAGFVPDTATTLVATIESPRGALPFIARAVGTYYVAFVARSQSGTAGPKSDTAGPTTVALIANAALASPVKPQEISFTASHTLTTTLTTVASTTITVPAGFTSATVSAVGTVYMYDPNTTGGQDGYGSDYVSSTFTIDGASVGSGALGLAYGNGGAATSIAVVSETLTGLTSGDTFVLGIEAKTDYFTIPGGWIMASGTVLWFR